MPGVAATAAVAVALNCWGAAAHRYNLPIELLYAIGQVESGHRVGAVGVNTNGSRDLGVMQINDRWLPELARYGISESDLVTKPCTNIQVGAWILATEVKRTGYSWYSIGAYNAGPLSSALTEQARASKLEKYRGYAGKVLARWTALRDRRRPPAEVRVAAADAGGGGVRAAR